MTKLSKEKLKSVQEPKRHREEKKRAPRDKNEKMKTDCVRVKKVARLVQVLSPLD